jgi:hypothetical protein
MSLPVVQTCHFLFSSLVTPCFPAMSLPVVQTCHFLFSSLVTPCFPAKSLYVSQPFRSLHSNRTDPAFHFDADPAVHFNANPDTASQNDADPCRSGTLVPAVVHCIPPMSLPVFQLGQFLYSNLVSTGISAMY